MPLTARVSRWLVSRLTEEAPGELFALMRIGAVLVTWSRLGAAMVPHAGMDPWAVAVAALFWFATTALLAGWGARWTTLVVAGCTYVVYVQWPQFGGDHLRSHHVMAQGLLHLYLALTPCDRALVPGRPSGTAPSWGLHLMRLQLAVLYAGATWEKAYPAWVSGERMEQILMTVFTGSDPLGPVGRALALLGANGTLVAEGLLAIAPLVARGRVRWVTFAAAVAFHIVVYELTPVSTFSATMAVWWLAVLDPREVAARLAVDPPEPEVRPTRPAVVVGVAALLLGLAVLPWRWLPDRGGFHLLGDDVCSVQTEAGAVSGPREHVRREVCRTRGALQARCVIDGVVEDVGRDEVCRPAPRGPRRRETAR